MALLAGWRAEAQPDLGKSLVGTWEGEVQLLGMGTRQDPHRTLIISSIARKDGGWVGLGRFGVTGKSLSPVQIVVKASGKNPWLRFVTALGTTVRVELVGDGRLAGTFNEREAGGALGSNRAITLEKKD